MTDIGAPLTVPTNYDAAWKIPALCGPRRMPDLPRLSCDKLYIRRLAAQTNYTAFRLSETRGAYTTKSCWVVRFKLMIYKGKP